MATNAFYKIPHQKRRSDASLPPLPIPTCSYSAYMPEYESRIVSPITPSSDSKTSYFQDSERSFYSGGRGGKANDSGRFSDNIPLRPQPVPSPSQEGFSRNDLPDGDRSLPAPISQRRRKRRREPEKKKGFFAGKVPWVVYTLTLVQVTVFIVEIVKNCTLREHGFDGLLISSSHSHRFTHRDTSTGQPDAGSIHIRPYKYGSPLCSMYAID